MKIRKVKKFNKYFKKTISEMIEINKAYQLGIKEISQAIESDREMKSKIFNLILFLKERYNIKLDEKWLVNKIKNMVYQGKTFEQAFYEIDNFFKVIEE
jgi:hypothetical protein